MGTKLNPYISFKDNARAAMEFYREVLGGELTFATFGEYQVTQDPSQNDLIMHAQLETPGGLTLMAADTPDGMPYEPGRNISISLSGDDSDQLTGYFAKLSTGGMVMVPLEKQEWGDYFGMIVDQFGIGWMVNIAGN